MDYYEQKYTQRGADIISLQDNALISVDLEIFAHDIKTDKSLFASPDTQAASRLRELDIARIKHLIFSILVDCLKIPNFLRL